MVAETLGNLFAGEVLRRSFKYLFDDTTYDSPKPSTVKRVNDFSEQHEKDLKSAIEYAYLDDHTKAVKFYQQALDGIRRELRPAHPMAGKALHGLAASYANLGWYKSALQPYKQALKIKYASRSSSQELTNILLSLAQVYADLDMYHEALPRLQQARELQEVIFGLNKLVFLAHSKKLIDRFIEVFPYCNDWLIKKYRKIRYRNHASLINIITTTGVIHVHYKNYTQALKCFQEALEKNKDRFGSDSIEASKNKQSIAITHYSSKQYEEALLWYRCALKGFKNKLGLCDLGTAKVIIDIGDTHKGLSEGDKLTEDDKRKQKRKAIAYYRLALKIKESALGSNHPKLVITLTNLATLYAHIQEYRKALPLLEHALKIQDKSLGENHLDLVVTLLSLGYTHYSLGDKGHEDAQRLYQRALKIQEDTLGESHPDLKNALILLALLCKDTLQLEKGEKYWKRVEKIDALNQ